MPTNNKKRLTVLEKGRITAGWDLYGSVAKILPLVPGRSESTVRSFIRRWIARGDIKNRMSPGRPPKLNRTDKRRICHEARKNRRKPLYELRNEVRGHVVVEESVAKVTLGCTSCFYTDNQQSSRYRKEHEKVDSKKTP